MFRILKYIVLLFVGYKLLKSVFGVSSQKINNAKEPNRVKENGNNEPKVEPTDKKPKEGEYIDFEEIK